MKVAEQKSINVKETEKAPEGVVVHTDEWVAALNERNKYILTKLDKEGEIVGIKMELALLKQSIDFFNQELYGTKINIVKKEGSSELTKLISLVYMDTHGIHIKDERSPLELLTPYFNTYETNVKNVRNSLYYRLFEAHFAAFDAKLEEWEIDEESKKTVRAYIDKDAGKTTKYYIVRR